MNSFLVAVTRQVKPGCEAAFDEALREFARESLHIPGTTGVHIIQPVRSLVAPPTAIRSHP